MRTSRPKRPYHPDRNLGYFVFKEKENILIAYSDQQNDITVIDSKKHYKIPNSKIPFFRVDLSGTVVSNGYFAWVFGGETIFDYEDFECSSIKGNFHKSNYEKSALWSMKKQVWFEGPTIPFPGCIFDACGIALNRSFVMLFIGPFAHHGLRAVLSS